MQFGNLHNLKDRIMHSEIPIEHAAAFFSFRDNAVQLSGHLHDITAYVPLLKLVKMVAHSDPDVASLLATTARIPSNTDWGVTYFHRSALLLPIVVSMVA